MDTVSYRRQARNANKHTERGLTALEQSVSTDGWIGAVTVARDGETFDGSARLEVGPGFDNPIVIESDGTRPIVHVRTDIASADDPRAVRLGIAANRVAELDLSWDADVLRGLGDDVDLSAFWTTDELGMLLDGMTVPDPEPQKEPQLASECFIEVYCSVDDLDEFRSTLDEWGRRDGVTINIS